MALIFNQLFEAESCTYTYLFADSLSGDALLIDPVLETAERDEALLKELDLTLRYTLETHCHADHVTGAAKLRERMGSTAVAHPQANIEGARTVEAGDVLRVGEMALETLATPGHTDGCVSYRGPGRVFTGDALLIGGCGRTDFQQGDASKLYDSVTNCLFNLPDETIVYPAHDYKGRFHSTVGEEKRNNARLANTSREAFIQLMAELALPYPKQLDRAVPANQRAGKAMEPFTHPVLVPPERFFHIPELFFVWINTASSSTLPPVPNCVTRTVGDLYTESDLPKSRTIGLTGDQESLCLAAEALLTSQGYDVVVLAGGWPGAVWA